MTKSLFIALAGFAGGLGVTTALTFVAPEFHPLGAVAENREPTTSQAAVQQTQQTDIPVVRQPLDLARLAPAAGPGSGAGPTASPMESPTASQLVMTITPSRPKVREVSPRPKIRKASPPPTPPQTMARAQSPRSGPLMPAVGRTDIQTAMLAPPASGGSNDEGDGEVDGTVESTNVIDAAEARRREQIEHDNVQLASVTPAPIMPPAPPPLADSGTTRQVAKGAAGSVPGARRRPTWQRFAALTPPVEGRARVAIVLDDMGLSQFRSDRAIALPRPVTLAVLPYGNHLHGLVARARTAGHEVMLHLPMEPNARDVDPGPNALLTGLTVTELDRRIAANLGRLNGYVGVNNHMGSRFTASGREMRRVMVALKKRNLLFLDSLTTGRSTGHQLARQFGIPTVVR
ncbi:MAG: hypothetical protein HOM07_20135, partial [Rhodospirillaceae bacterium]|nr:hypothetical protein [Rhodospirillaceae bacterium]